MKKNKQRWIVIAAAAVLVVTAVVLVAVTRNRKKKPASEEDFKYVKYSSYSYSEHLVLCFDHENRLHMIDTDSGKDMVCCDRPNCTHEGASAQNPKPSCPAVFGGIKGLNGPVLHNGHLYVVGNMTNDDVFKTQFLYEADPNGENRKSIATLDNVQDVMAVLFRDKYAIGVYLNTVELDENGMIISDNKIREGGIFVIDLENHKVQKGELYSGRQSEIDGLYYENGAVYYGINRFLEDLSTEEIMEIYANIGGEAAVYDHRVFEVYRYDIADGKTTLLKTLDHVMYPQMLDGDVYYVTPEGFYMYDSGSGETSKLPIERDEREPYGLFAKSEKAFYYSLSVPGSDEVTTYRLEGGKVYEVLKKTRGGSYLSVVMICGESVYVNYDDEDGRGCLGVLSLDDYNHGKVNVKKLRCLDEEE